MEGPRPAVSPILEYTLDSSSGRMRCGEGRGGSERSVAKFVTGAN